MIDHDDPCGPDWDLPARQARWRSRRGLLELDLLLPEFAAHEYLNLAPELRRAYARLLDCDRSASRDDEKEMRSVTALKPMDTILIAWSGLRS